MLQTFQLGTSGRQIVARALDASTSGRGRSPEPDGLVPPPGTEYSAPESHLPPFPPPSLGNQRAEEVVSTLPSACAGDLPEPPPPDPLSALFAAAAAAADNVERRQQLRSGTTVPPAGARKDPNGSPPPLPPVPPRATVGSKTAGAEGCSDDLDELLFGGGFFVDTLDLNESTAAGPSRGSAVLPSLHAQAKVPPSHPPDLLAPTAPPS